MKGKPLTYHDAKPRKTQHTSPCSDCPFARAALAGWLGGSSVEEWIQAVHGEAMIDCHTVSNQQCAGAAIYRANVSKLCRTPDRLRLPPDCVKVFASTQEFRSHHEKRFFETEEGETGTKSSDEQNLPILRRRAR